VKNGGMSLFELWDVLDENGNKTGRLHERGMILTIICLSCTPGRLMKGLNFIRISEI
jgi:hypothetical protein